MKKYIALIIICLVGLFFASCAAREYIDTLSCQTIANSLASKIGDPQDYEFYTDEDIKYTFEDTTLFADCSFIYSASSDNIDEICVIKAENENDAKQVLSQAEQYLSDLCEEKKSFLENYLPGESQKLDCAKAKQFDNYVIIALADKDDTKEIFKRAEELLRK